MFKTNLFTNKVIDTLSFDSNIKPDPESCSVTKAGASIYNTQSIDITYPERLKCYEDLYTRTMTNKLYLQEINLLDMKSISLESKNWRLMTFKPLNKPYQDDIQWFNDKMINRVFYKYIKNRHISYMCVVKEICETKIHLHAIVNCNDTSIDDEHDKVIYHKLKVDVRPLDSYDRGLRYITKEFEYNNIKPDLYSNFRTVYQSPK